MATNDKEKNIEYVRKCRSKLTTEKKQYLNQYYCRSWTAWIGRHTNTCIAEDRNKGREFNIDVGFIADLLKNQNNRCCMTNIELTHDKSLRSMSIDRIDNTKGHTIDNVQLTCRAINLAKNRHTNSELCEFLDNIIKPVFETCKISRDYVSTCIRNHKQRDENKGLTCDITTDYILDLYGKNNKCYFSNIYLAAHKHPMFSLSVDRINNNNGHVIGNVRLVTKAINRAKRDYADSDMAKWIKDVRSYYVRNQNM